MNKGPVKTAGYVKKTDLLSKDTSLWALYEVVKKFERNLEDKKLGAEEAEHLHNAVTKFYRKYVSRVNNSFANGVKPAEEQVMLRTAENDAYKKHHEFLNPYLKIMKLLAGESNGMKYQIFSHNKESFESAYQNNAMTTLINAIFIEYITTPDFEHSRVRAVFGVDNPHAARSTSTFSGHGRR